MAASTGLAGRYASALFDLARERGRVGGVGDGLAALGRALAGNDDLRRLTTSPVLARADAERGVLAAAASLGLDDITTSFLGVLARARRLAQLPAIIREYRALAAAERGETTATVTSARPLDPDQAEQVRDTLRRKLRREVDVDLRVDPAILGGLVVRVGSRVIDSSIKTKLAAVGAAMRG